MPLTNPHAIAISRYKDRIVFGSGNKENNAFNAYYPSEGKVEGPVVKVVGFPVFFHEFK